MVTLDEMKAKQENILKEREQKLALKQAEKEKEKLRKLQAKEAERNQRKKQASLYKNFGNICSNISTTEKTI